MKTKKALLAFATFIAMLILYSSFIALCSHWFLLNGWPAKTLQFILTGCTIYAVYTLWRYLCRRLDMITSTKNKVEKHSKNR